MTNKKSNDNRRKLLKSIAAGSGAVVAGKSLPESWSKPVIDSVVLPVHAETTNETTSAPSVSCPGGTCYVEFDENVKADFGILVLAGIVYIDGYEIGCDGGFAGSEQLNSDGSFSVKVSGCGVEDGPGTITGKITSDCSSVSGLYRGFNYSSSWDPNLTSFDQCIDD